MVKRSWGRQASTTKSTCLRSPLVAAQALKDRSFSSFGVAEQMPSL